MFHELVQNLLIIRLPHLCTHHQTVTLYGEKVFFQAHFEPVRNRVVVHLTEKADIAFGDGLQHLRITDLIS